MPEEELKPCCKCGAKPEIWGNGSKACFEKLQVFCPLPKGCGRSTGWINTKDPKVATKEWNKMNTPITYMTPEEEKELVEEMASSIKGIRNFQGSNEYYDMAISALSVIKDKYELRRKG